MFLFTERKHVCQPLRAKEGGRCPQSDGIYSLSRPYAILLRIFNPRFHVMPLGRDNRDGSWLHNAALVQSVPSADRLYLLPMAIVRLSLHPVTNLCLPQHLRPSFHFNEQVYFWNFPPRLNKKHSDIDIQHLMRG